MHVCMQNGSIIIHSILKLQNLFKNCMRILFFFYNNVNIVLKEFKKNYNSTKFVYIIKH